MQFVHSVVQNPHAMECMTIRNFIVCTRESDERNPQVVQRNIRQFMDGMARLIVTEHSAAF